MPHSRYHNSLIPVPVTAPEFVLSVAPVCKTGPFCPRDLPTGASRVQNSPFLPTAWPTDS